MDKHGVRVVRFRFLQTYMCAGSLLHMVGMSQVKGDTVLYVLYRETSG